MKLNPVRYIWLRIWGDRSVIAAVIRFPTAPRQVWCSPRWQKPDAKLWHRFFFCCIFAFCLVELLPSRLVFSFVIPPHLSSEISFISFSIFFFFFFFFYPLCTKRRSVGGGEGAEIRRKTEDKGCTLSSFCFRVSKARSPAWLPCELLCEGARRRSPRPVKHCSLFFLSPPLWPVMRKDIQQKRKRFQCTLEPCLCLYNCAYFALRGAPADVRRISTSLH